MRGHKKEIAESNKIMKQARNNRRGRGSSASPFKFLANCFYGFVGDDKKKRKQIFILEVFPIKSFLFEFHCFLRVMRLLTDDVFIGDVF